MKWKAGSEKENFKTEIEQFEESKELSGDLGYGSSLMKSVLENDSEKIEQGQLIEDSINQGLGAMTSDLFMEKFVKNYNLAKKMFGESLIRRISGYDSSYVEKNIKVPEFQKELRKKIDDKLQKMKQDGLLDREGGVTEEGEEIAALILYTEGLDDLAPRGTYGEKIHKEPDKHGLKEGIKNYRKGDRYRDISVKKTVRKTIRRKHKEIHKDDLKVYERQSKGMIEIIYGLDASASMKGNRIRAAKKAGIALAYNAIQEHDKVGLIVFGEDIKGTLIPTTEFGVILKSIANVKASGQTDFTLTLKKSIDLFSHDNVTKHLILLTDALPTAGDRPERETLQAVSMASGAGITVSLVGLGLDKEGEKLAQKIVELGNGKLFVVKDIEDLDKVILEDYYGLR